MSNINWKRFWWAWLASFTFIFVFEGGFHGFLLDPIYAESESLWRAKEDSIFWSLLLGQLLLPIIFLYIFLKGYENRGVWEGVRYGVLIGLLFVPTNFIWYAVQPLPFILIVAWIVGGIIEMALAGAIVAKIYRPATA